MYYRRESAITILSPYLPIIKINRSTVFYFCRLLHFFLCFALSSPIIVRSLSHCLGAGRCGRNFVPSVEVTFHVYCTQPPCIMIIFLRRACEFVGSKNSQLSSKLSERFLHCNSEQKQHAGASPSRAEPTE